MQFLVGQMYCSDYGINKHEHKEVEGLPYYPVVIVKLGVGGLPELLPVVTCPDCCCRRPPKAPAPAPAAGYIPKLRKSAITPTCLCRPPLQPAAAG